MKLLLRTAALVAAGFAASFAAAALPTAPIVEVYKNAACGCCSKWIEHLEQHGFTVRAHDVPDTGAVRRKLSLPDKYGACHTAVVAGYAIEGHVPAQDIKRLLAERPDAIGIAVPSMPPGSPGMESERPIAYDTLLIRKDGTSAVLARH